MRHIAIVGAGWAGLSAGVFLARNGFKVTVLEAAPQIGGRARTIRLGEQELDNGQHFLVGAYRELLSLISLLGISEQEVFLRKPIHLMMLNRYGHDVLDFKLPHSYSVFYSVVSILKISSLFWRERLCLLSFFRDLKNNKLLLKKDKTVEIFLKQMGISPRLIEIFFSPLCQAALSTPIQVASANCFIRVLKETFGGESHYSDGLFPKKTLSDCFPNPAKRFIEKNGGCVLLRQRVVGFRKDEKDFSVFTETGILKADDVILATHPKACLSLIEQEERLLETTNLLKNLRYQPITTLYFQYPFPQKTSWEMIGLIGTTSQWLFNSSHLGLPGLISIIVSGDGPHMAWSKNVLLDHIEQELKVAFPKWNVKPIRRLLIREKEAALYASPNFADHQPKNLTNLPGLWLAGDYTVSEYPSTLESAVRSGIECAKHITHLTYNFPHNALF